MKTAEFTCAKLILQQQLHIIINSTTPKFFPWQRRYEVGDWSKSLENSEELNHQRFCVHLKEILGIKDVSNTDLRVWLYGDWTDQAKKWCRYYPENNTSVPSIWFALTGVGLYLLSIPWKFVIVIAQPSADCSSVTNQILGMRNISGGPLVHAVLLGVFSGEIEKESQRFPLPQPLLHHLSVCPLPCWFQMAWRLIWSCLCDRVLGRGYARW